MHILGASGSGTTTLASALGHRWGCPHLDTDDFYWLPTDPPYKTKRPRPERLRRLKLALHPPAWVLSGSLCGWGDPLIPLFDLVVYLDTPSDIRLRRLARREAERYGRESVEPGGWRYEASQAFLEWAARYDEGGPDMRSKARHEAWLRPLPCRWITLSGTQEQAELVEAVETALA